MSFSVQLTPDLVALEPGATTPVSVVVVNRGAEADRFELEVEGIDPEWKLIPVGVFAVEGEESHTEKVFFKPPRSSESQAGNYPFVVRVRSLNSGEQRTVQGVAQVKPFHHVSMEINPRKGFVSPLRKQNSFDVTLVNLGNTEHTVQLVGSDPEDSCAYEFDHERLTVGPGQQRDVEVIANPTSSPILSGVRLIGFTVTGRSVDSPTVAASAQAQLELRPLLSPTSLAVAVIVFILLGAWYAMMPKMPGVTFSVDPRSGVETGTTVTIKWVAENAKRVTVSANDNIVYDGPALNSQATYTLVEAGPITFRATALSGDNRKTETIQVTVGERPIEPEPVIEALSPNQKSIRLGQPFVMRYRLSPSVLSATLQPTGDVIDPALNEVEVTPARVGDIEYTLVARNRSGQTTRRSFTVSVVDESDARILAFQPSATTVPFDNRRVTLTWQVTGAERVELRAGQNTPLAVSSTGAQEFAIEQKTVFVLTAIDAKGRRATQNVTVNVQAAPPPPVDTTGGGIESTTSTTDLTTGSTITTGASATTAGGNR